MDEPVDYGTMGEYLTAKYHLPTIGVRTEFHSTWLDNTKARFLLNWKPEYDLKKMIDAAWQYERAASDPRIIWYPG
jgi:UDP-glucose 4-epimerase